MSVLVACGLLFFLSDLARSRGKAREQQLFAKWGGLPSTQLLRYRDNKYFEASQVKRFHDYLAGRMGVAFPTEAQEANDPKTADAIYASAGSVLRSETRDTTTFQLLFKDNISYGFRRNALGLRGIAISMCIGSLIWVYIRQGPSMWVSRLSEAVNPETFFTGGEITTIGMSIGVMLAWLVYMTEKSVQEAAFTYARSLIEACETLRSRADSSAPSD